jgi:uncharacterized protein
MHHRMRILALLFCLLFVAPACRGDGAAEAGAAASEAPPTTEETEPEAARDAPPAAEYPAITVDRPCPDLEVCEALCATCEAECPPEAARACHEAARLYLIGEPTDIATSAEREARACEGGHLPACSALGLLHQDGRGVPWDLDGARDLYTKACSGGSGVGCFNLGLMYDGGVGVDPDPNRATEHFMEARRHLVSQCEAGELFWCVNLGVLHETGRGTPTDRIEARRVYRAACEKGDGDACVNLALVGLALDDAPDDALGLLAHACAHDVALACAILGDMRLSGWHGAPDVAGGLARLDVACRGGVPAACTAAGRHRLGDGDAPAAGVRQLKRACDLGDPVGCGALARHLWSTGDAAAAREALGHAEQACRLGDGNVCLQLARLHGEGARGIEADAVTEVAYLKTACRLGQIEACLDLFVRGETLPLSNDLRTSVLAQGCQMGVAKACDAAGD